MFNEHKVNRVTSDSPVHDKKKYTRVLLSHRNARMWRRTVRATRKTFGETKRIITTLTFGRGSWKPCVRELGQTADVRVRRIPLASNRTSGGPSVRPSRNSCTPRTSVDLLLAVRLLLRGRLCAVTAFLTAIADGRADVTTRAGGALPPRATHDHLARAIDW